MTKQPVAMGESEKVTRVTLDLPRDRLERLRNGIAPGGTNPDVVRRALNLVEYMLRFPSSNFEDVPIQIRRPL